MGGWIGMLAAVTVACAPIAAAAACPEVGFTVVEPAVSAQTRTVRFLGRPMQVRREVLTRTADIAAVRVEQVYGKPVLMLNFRPEAAARLQDATTDHDGLRLAFVADDEALLSIQWRGKDGMGREGAQVSLENAAGATRLYDSLRACVPR